MLTLHFLNWLIKESFFPFETIPHFQGAHRAGHTASWEPLQLSIPFIRLPFGIILPREKKWYWHFWPIHPMFLENLNTDIFILWCNIFVVWNWWVIESLGSGVREDVIAITTRLLTSYMALGKIVTFLCLSLPTYRVDTITEPRWKGLVRLNRVL